MTTKRPALTITLALPLPLAVGCGLSEPDVCTLEAVFGVNVSLTDDAGVPISGAMLVITEDDYQETMAELRPGKYAGAVERAGTYDLTVDAAGFPPRQLDGLVVFAGECHVLPVSRDIVLTPDSGITGIMLAGPQCPVVGPDVGEDCDDQPYPGTVIIKTVDGDREITRFTADETGALFEPSVAITLAPLSRMGPGASLSMSWKLCGPSPQWTVMALGASRPRLRG